MHACCGTARIPWRSRLLCPTLHGARPQEHCISHPLFGGPPELLSELGFALVHRKSTQRDIETALRQASPYCRPLRPRVPPLRSTITFDDLSRQVPEVCRLVARVDAAADAARGGGPLVSTASLARGHFLGAIATDFCTSHSGGKLVGLTHKCMLSDASWAATGAALAGQLTNALPR